MMIPRKYGNEPKIIIFSGAGLDAPSGIQTFRGTNGLWNDHKIADVCTESSWKKNFELIHKFYNERRTSLKDSKPNSAHLIIKEIVDKYGPENVFNITMNISDFFERLNVPTLHLHGELTKMSCDACGKSWSVDYKEFDISSDICKCGSLKGVRPKIVFFGGVAPMYSYYKRALEYLDEEDSIVVVIGTQGNVIEINKDLMRKPCHKVLCNLESSPYIRESNFEKVYIESVETAMPKIKDYIFSTFKP